MAPASTTPKRKQLTIDSGVLHALEALSRDGGRDLPELVDEALRDLLAKHQRPVGLRDALQQSARAVPANDAAPGASTRTTKTRARETESAKPRSTKKRAR